MSNYSDAELRELRLINQIVNETLFNMGIEPTNPKSFDELVASGDLKAAECYVTSKDMVDPGWLERATRDRS